MLRPRKLLVVAMILVGMALVPKVAWSQTKVAVVDNVQAVLKMKLDVHQAVAAVLDDLHVSMIAIEDMTPADAECTDAACFSAVAKRVGATHLLLLQGVANPAGYRLNLDIRSGQTGKSLGTDGKDCELCAEDQFAPTVRERVGKLWNRLVQEQALQPPTAAPSTAAPLGSTAANPSPERSGVDTSAIPPWWQQTTPLMGVGFSAVGLLAIGFGIYYVAVDGNTVESSKMNRNAGVILRDTGKWGWRLVGVGAVSLLAGSAMVIWGRDDGTSVSVAVGPGSLGLQGKF